MPKYAEICNFDQILHAEDKNGSKGVAKVNTSQ